MDKKLIILACILAAIIAIPPASAQTYCLNASWSRTAIAIDGDSLLLDEYCPYNCSSETQTCSPGYPTPTENLMIVGGLIFVAALLLYLGMKLKEKHWVMQYFFMFIALFLILSGIYFIFNLQALSWAQVGSIMTTNYTIILYTVILFLFYFILQIIINAVRSMSGGKKE